MMNVYQTNILTMNAHTWCVFNRDLFAQADKYDDDIINIWAVCNDEKHVAKSAISRKYSLYRNNMSTHTDYNLLEQKVLKDMLYGKVWRKK